MRECRSCCEGEFEGLLEEEATEDHEVVTIAVLRLHDCGGLEARRVHKMEIVWLSYLVVGICASLSEASTSSRRG